MVSMDVVRNCPKRKINHEPESPPVIVPRTGAASLKTINEFSQRSKVQFTLPSSPEKVNVQKTKVNVLDSKVSDAASKVNKLHANNMTSENDVIKCPLSSLQKALKSSVNGGKILHSLKSNTNLTSRSTGVDTRSTKNGIEYSKLEISSEKRFVSNDGSVKIIKIVSPKKCNDDSSWSKVTVSDNGSKSPSFKVSPQIKVLTDNEKPRVSLQRLGYNQLKSTEELPSSPEDEFMRTNSIHAQNELSKKEEQKLRSCDKKSYERSPQKLTSGGVSSLKTSARVISPGGKSRGSGLKPATTPPKSAIQSSNIHQGDHDYSPVKRITSPPKVNILKRGCSVNKRSTLLEFLETVKQGNLTPPKKVQKFSDRDQLLTAAVRKELFLPKPGHSAVIHLSNSPPSKKLRKSQNNNSGSNIGNKRSKQDSNAPPPSTVEILANSSALTPLLQYPKLGAEVTPLLNPDLDNERTEMIDHESEFLLARQDYPTLDSIFMHFQRCQELKHSIDQKTPPRSKDIGLSLADANQLMAQKRLALNPSLESCMGLGVPKEPRFYEKQSKGKSSTSSSFGSPRSAFRRHRNSPLSSEDITAVRHDAYSTGSVSNGGGTIRATASDVGQVYSEVGFNDQNCSQAITLQVIAPQSTSSMSLSSIICNSSDLETMRQSGHNNWVATILPPTPTPISMTPQPTIGCASNAEGCSHVGVVCGETLREGRENTNHQLIHQSTDVTTPINHFFPLQSSSLTPSPIGQKMRQTTFVTPLQRGTPLIQSPAGPSILTMSDPLTSSSSDVRSGVTSSRDSSEWRLTPQPAKRVNKSMKRVATDSKQLVLDFGQKDFGTKYCSGCGFVYTPSHPNDLALHEKHHNKFFRLLKYTLRGTECVVDSWTDGVAVRVPAKDDGSLLHKKVKELRSRVDSDLGFVDDLNGEETQDPYTCVFISSDGFLTGYLLAEKIQSAYRVIPNDDSRSDQEQVKKSCGQFSKNDSVDSVSSSWSCSLTSESAVVGVSRIWVAPKAQRKGVASRLVDTLRVNFSAEGTIPRDLVAFSDPTNSGRLFAMSYMKRKDFLVFKCFQSELPVRDFLKEQEDRDRELLYCS